jgi:hypothetical protein
MGIIFERPKNSKRKIAKGAVARSDFPLLRQLSFFIDFLCFG